MKVPEKNQNPKISPNDEEILGALTSPIQERQLQLRASIRKLGDSMVFGAAVAGVIGLYLCCGINACLLQIKKLIKKDKSKAA